jgi:hypothetical protein
MNPEYEPHWSKYLQQFANLPALEFQRIRRDTNKFCVIVEPPLSSPLDPRNQELHVFTPGQGVWIDRVPRNDQ